MLHAAKSTSQRNRTGNRKSSIGSSNFCFALESTITASIFWNLSIKSTICWYADSASFAYSSLPILFANTFSSFALMVSTKLALAILSAILNHSRIHYFTVHTKNVYAQISPNIYVYIYNSYLYSIFKTNCMHLSCFVIRK